MSNACSPEADRSTTVGTPLGRMFGPPSGTMATSWLPTVPDGAMFRQPTGCRDLNGEPRRDVDRGPRGDHRSTARGRLGVHGRSRGALGMVRGGRLAPTGTRWRGAVPIRRRRRAPRPGGACRTVPHAHVALAGAPGRGVRQPDRGTVFRHDRPATGPRWDPRTHHRASGTGARRSGPMTARDHNAVFQALGDPTRRTLLRALSASGPSTLAELSSGVSVSRQAVSKHLALLQDAGLVVGRGEVRGRRYELTPAPLADALGWMVDVGAGWDDRLARLKRQVEGRRR